jgi:bifunctional non-homologous end joining protein LigD
MAFDVLYSDERDLTQDALRERRLRLEDVVAGSDRVFPVRRLADNGLNAWAQVLHNGYEGYIARDLLSPYLGGGSRSWLKVKCRSGRTRRIGSSGCA